MSVIFSVIPGISNMGSSLSNGSNWWPRRWPEVIWWLLGVKSIFGEQLYVRMSISALLTRRCHLRSSGWDLIRCAVSDFVIFNDLWRLNGWVRRDSKHFYSLANTFRGGLPPRSCDHSRWWFGGNCQLLQYKSIATAGGFPGIPV